MTGSHDPIMFSKFTLSELYYLQPGYDINNLKMSQLRGVLLSHNISYSGLARKTDLIAAVREKILPQAQALLRDAARVERSSRGIRNAKVVSVDEPAKRRVLRCKRVPKKGLAG